MLLFREMTPRMDSIFSTLLGSTADTCSASVYEAFWKNFTRFLLDMTAENCGVSAVAVHRWSSIISFRGAQADSHGPLQKTIEILLQYIDNVIDGVVQVQQIRALLWETVENPQLQLVECLGQVVDIPVVAQLQFPLIFQRLSSCCILTRWSMSLFCRSSFRVPSLRRQSSSHGCTRSVLRRVGQLTIALMS